MLWYSFEQLQNYICCRTVSFICKIFPCIQKEVKYHSTLTCRDKQFESPFLGFLWVILTDSTLFCFCRNHYVHLLSELVLVLWPCYFPNCCYNRTYIENFVTFISWFILCSNVNNMGIFSQLPNLFIRHNMDNFRIAGLSCPVQIVIWKFHYTHQICMPRNCSISLVLVEIFLPCSCTLYKCFYSTRVYVTLSVQNNLKKSIGHIS